MVEINVSLKNPPPETLWLMFASRDDYAKWLDELKMHCPNALLIGANNHGAFYLVQGQVIGALPPNAEATRR